MTEYNEKDSVPKEIENENELSEFSLLKPDKIIEARNPLKPRNRLKPKNPIIC